MQSKMAQVLYDRCQPDKCDGGICAAAAACPRRSLRQDAPYEAPMAMSPCRACGDCVHACPAKAIEIVNA
ncbi:MAG: hypothetical protein HYX92_04945 [Chloroflexi bacterium]|nr:hypothetical protein [Chloroflexota bacterium]